MASLQILKGTNEWVEQPLETDKTILGRNPQCHVVIPATSVSREHACIVRDRDQFYIEDLQSRNGTFVNNNQITTRTLLNHNDRIRICDFQATFENKSQLQALQPLPVELQRQSHDLDDEPDTNSTVEATLHGSRVLLESHSAEKLRALLEITSNLSKTLELDSLLPKIVDSLFQVFRQADRCFIILEEEGTGRLLPKVIKTRRPADETKDRFSKSIVKRCLQTGQAMLSKDASNDKNIPLSQSVVDFRIHSVMCAPLLTASGEGFGVIQLDTQDRITKFTEDDLKLLIGVTSQASIALENARMHENMVDQERAKRDLELAHQVQFSFLPKQLPELAGYEFFAHYEPALAVGGDYYDFIPLSSQRLAIMLGDVAGKGVPAALLMAKLSGDARYTLLTEHDPGAAVTKLNELLIRHLETMDRFITLAAAILDPINHTITLVNAGHLVPLHYHHSTGLIEEAGEKEMAGLPLGIMEGQNYASCQVKLEPGDTLLLYTDGVTDAVNARGVQFSSQGPYAALKDGGPFSPRSLGEKVVKAVKQHVAGFSPYDDVTLVSFGRVLA